MPPDAEPIDPGEPDAAHKRDEPEAEPEIEETDEAEDNSLLFGETPVEIDPDYADQVDQAMVDAVIRGLADAINPKKLYHAEIMAEVEARHRLIGYCVDGVAKLVTPDINSLIAPDTNYRLRAAPEGCLDAIEGLILDLAATARRALAIERAELADDDDSSEESQS